MSKGLNYNAVYIQSRTHRVGASSRPLCKKTRLQLRLILHGQRCQYVHIKEGALIPDARIRL